MKKPCNGKCKIEQKIAYNILFADGHINEISLNHTLKRVDMFHADEVVKKYKNFDVELLKQCIAKNFDTYVKNPFIAGSYEEIAEKLPL
jgi:hypothetical protein